MSGGVDYTGVIAEVSAAIPAPRVVTDPLRRLAYGTDASFYRLTPQVVVEVADEGEVRAVLAICRRHRAPVTFRAAGTSLSGQAIGDGVLMTLGRGWTMASVERGGALIRLQPGVIGAEANRRLAGFQRKLGPDPASIDTCKIGGIAANNASGMCCGTADNSYQTMAAMRVILADGATVDTGDAASVAAFGTSHGALLEGLGALARRVRANPELEARIRRKFAIKNTTGYSLNALVDHSDPLDILTHLMIGSEGTLGFIAEITYRTVADPAAKASALLLFPDIGEAALAVMLLKPAPVSAVELMDRASLRSVADQPGMPAQIRGLPDGAAALLVEIRAEDDAALKADIAAVLDVLAGVGTLFKPAFTDDPAEYGKLWKIRKGLFPAVGAVRRLGTTVIIEDVAFPIHHLAAATLDLERLCHAHGYHEAIIFGHALDGNLHFVFTQDFSSDAEVARYAGFMEAVAGMVVATYDGSLKAEHGTGRNMAPFVEREWGAEAHGLMREIKRLFDPDHLLNPGVILNDDPNAHLAHLKPLPAADPLVDTCIECGFCEPQCPSQFLTLTPRQRITARREIGRLEMAGDGATAATLARLYDYQGIDTCAACGLCGTVCPVAINTGEMIKGLRGRRLGGAGHWLAGWLGAHVGAVAGATRLGLGAAATLARVVGPERLEAVSGAARRLSGERLPAWHRAMPTAARWSPGPERASTGSAATDQAEVVYLPSCVSRTMGPGLDDPDARALPSRVEALLRQAGYRVIYPPGLAGLCCGQPFESKGLDRVAAARAAEVGEALRIASRDGALPIVSDTSPCSLRLKRELEERLRPLDIIEFLHDHLLPRLSLTPIQQTVAIHVTCSAQRMGLADKLAAIAGRCAAAVVRPAGVGCCGFAGDKGFTVPELNAHALRALKSGLPEGCEQGFSNSRACEIGLSRHSGIPYRSIVDLVSAAANSARP